MEVTAVVEVAGLESTPRSENTKPQSTASIGRADRRESNPRRGSRITDKWMQSKPSRKDQWNTNEASRGAGRLVVRITPGGERLFYFRLESGGPGGKTGRAASDTLTDCHLGTMPFKKAQRMSPRHAMQCRRAEAIAVSRHRAIKCDWVKGSL